MGDGSLPKQAAALGSAATERTKLMRNLMPKTAVALGLAGSLALGLANPTLAAPLPTGTLAVKAANPDTATDVRWRGGPGPFFVGAAAAGLVGAAAFGGYPYGYYGAPYPYYRPYAYYGAPYPYYRRPYWRHRYVRYGYGYGPGYGYW
jgi:hypothetical protein